MIVFAYLLIMIASLLVIYGGIKILIEAFRVDTVWGLLVLFVGPAGLVFVILHWHDEDVRNPFYVQLAGVGVLVLGAVVAMAGS